MFNKTKVKSWIKFQSTHPCGVRLISVPQRLGDLTFQSTHPCGVRLVVLKDENGEFVVSIHAPLRGATVSGPAPRGRSRCFNPRTPAGCDLLVLFVGQPSTRFNPRTPAGCDPANGFKEDSAEYVVSIHAPLRGATPLAVAHNGIISMFQSTHPCGVRRVI